MAESNVQINVTANVASAVSALNRVSQSMQEISRNTGMEKLSESMTKFGSKMKSFGDTMSKTVSLPLLGLGIASTKLASDLAESTNKVEVVFGKSADAVKSWSSTTLKSFGIAKGTALDMASTFGDMATSMKVPQEQASAMSQKLVGLAGDLASFKNIGVDRANEALTGIFTGETEAMKSLGVVMTETNLKAFALSQGITKSYDSMSEAEKVNLRYQYVLNATKNAQGDFARTATGTANETRTFGQVLKEVGANFGQYILPVITPVIARLNELMIAFGQLSPQVKQVILIIAGIAIAIFPVISVLGSLIASIGTIGTAIAGAGGAMALLTNPITIVIASIVALIAIFTALYTHNEAFRAKVQEVWAFVQQIISQAVANIMTIISVFVAVASAIWKQHGDTIMAVVMSAFNIVVAVIKTALVVISGIIQVFAGLLTGNWSKVWEGIKQIVSSVWNGIGAIITNYVNLIKNTISAGLGVVGSIVSNIFNGIKNNIVNLFSSAVNYVGGQLGRLKSMFSGLSLQLPHIKLPHFTISGSFSLNPPRIPSIGVNWYAKGGVFDSPSVIGVGEAGQEAVLPLTNDRTMGMLAGTLAEYWTPDNVNGNDSASVVIEKIEINALTKEESPEKLAKRCVEAIDSELAKREGRNRRGNGRNRL